MIEQVSAKNSQGSVLDLFLYDVSNGYVMEEVGGLDPVKATLTSSSFAQLDGAQFQGASRETRNITLKIGMEPDFINNTVQSLRRGLYAFFMPKAPVSLQLVDSDGLVVDIAGYVETCQAPLFTDEPVMDVSIICYDPDFVDDVPTTLSGLSTPYNEQTPLQYNGSVETGIIFQLMPDRNIDTFTIYHTPPDGNLYALNFAINPVLVAGDILTISTIPGQKAATLYHPGGGGSVLYGIDPTSDWISLQPGVNDMRVYAIGAGLPYSITYTNKYGGL